MNSVIDNLKSNYIHSIEEDKFGNIWLGTVDNGIAILKKEEQSIQIDTLFVPVDSLSHYSVWPLLESRDAQTIWIGTYGGGINSVDMRPGYNTVNRQISNDSLFHSIKYVLSLHEDQNGYLSIGTLGQGMVRFDPQSLQLDHYTIEEDLPHNSVSCIQSDQQGNLWVGTYNGLAYLDVSADSIYRFTEADGLPGNYFFESACDTGSNGTLYFGTNKGLLQFDPSDIKIDKRLPKAVITGVDLYNKSLQADSSIIYKRHVQLKHDQNYVTVHYSGLHFAMPEENRYAYMLEGVDRDWIKVDSDHRSASYPSLFPVHTGSA